MRVIRQIAIIVTMICISSPSLGAGCGNPYDTRGIGPLDYRKRNQKYIKENIYLVEKAHFTPWIEQMAIDGISIYEATIPEEREDMLSGHLDYTLHAIPNHPRALFAMGMRQLSLRNRAPNEFIREWRFKTAECYFDRAIQFTPDYAKIYLAHGIYLQRIGNMDKSLTQLLKAENLNPNDAETLYSLGLLYLKRGDNDRALAYAKKAYALGYSLPYLRKKLKEIGEWSEEGAH